VDCEVVIGGPDWSSPGQWLTSTLAVVTAPGLLTLSTRAVVSGGPAGCEVPSSIRLTGPWGVEGCSTVQLNGRSATIAPTMLRGPGAPLVASAATSTVLTLASTSAAGSEVDLVSFGALRVVRSRSAPSGAPISASVNVMGRLWVGGNGSLTVVLGGDLVCGPGTVWALGGRRVVFTPRGPEMSGSLATVSVTCPMDMTAPSVDVFVPLLRLSGASWTTRGLVVPEGVSLALGGAFNSTFMGSSMGGGTVLVGASSSLTLGPAASMGVRVVASDPGSRVGVAGPAPGATQGPGLAREATMATLVLMNGSALQVRNYTMGSGAQVVLASEAWMQVTGVAHVAGGTQLKVRAGVPCAFVCALACRVLQSHVCVHDSKRVSV
jgi:hypothetical protein